MDPVYNNNKCLLNDFFNDSYVYDNEKDSCAID